MLTTDKLGNSTPCFGLTNVEGDIERSRDILRLPLGSLKPIHG
jgi:hypothetical protein